VSHARIAYVKVACGVIYFYRHTCYNISIIVFNTFMCYCAIGLFLVFLKKEYLMIIVVFFLDSKIVLLQKMGYYTPGLDVVFVAMVF
jgi:hypothetical protein